MNLVQTNNSKDVFYTYVFEVDNEAYFEIMNPEMGRANIENRKIVNKLNLTATDRFS